MQGIEGGGGPEGVRGLGPIDGLAQIEELGLAEALELEAKGIVDQAREMCLVPDLQAEAGGEEAGKLGLERRIARGERAVHHDHHAARGLAGGRSAAVLSPHALGHARSRVAESDLDEVRRQLARDHPDGREHAGAQPHLLVDLR